MSALTARGRGVAVGSPLLLVLGWALGYRTIIALGVTGLLALTTALLWVLTRQRLRITRLIDPIRVTVGETVLGRISVRNLARRPAAPFMAQDQISRQLLDVPIPRLASGATKTTTYRLPTNKRQVAHVGPVIIARGDPLGLLRIEQRHGEVETLWVHPRRYPIEPLGSSQLRSLDGPRDDKMTSGSTTFDRIREYVVGDDMRHIHWRSTARLGTLMVRQHVDATLPDVTVVVDTSAERYVETSFETAMEVAASILVASTSRRFPARLVVTGTASHQRPSQRDSGQDFLDALAGLSPNPDANLAATLTTLARERRGSGLVVISAELGDDELTSLNAVHRRFESLVLVLIGGPDRVPRSSIPGVRIIQAASGPEFADRWALALR